ncbi:MAG: GNAT family N-acetyltransferase [Desulfarculaceae bacterium]|nr:GNAT family N-acetyltransferase [Desulfarculaceae bacterium]MCF8049286.1 GNAT family N-acetyltransferase [Desulfarculaceae bacterium]MCF8099293.1 GNAT family N-acetyltransferase [Desulfarculaceae bacterium]MCF8122038.1 GNAT family N-acetyltransferase [Desulfarculaceae bacterium]
MFWREDVLPSDVAVIQDMTAASGFFRPAEVAVAAELASERLAKGAASGYLFIFAQEGPQVLGYACYGPIAGTLHSWDLYWIVVQKHLRGQGLGSGLLELVEQRVWSADGERLYVETSSLPRYRPTRRFYQSLGYAPQAVLADFYAPGDDKVIYVKRLSRPWTGQPAQKVHCR